VSDDNWSLETISSLKEISENDWNACAFDQGKLANPFITHQFLLALEASDSAVADTGWYAQHLVLRDGSRDIAAVVPVYLKNHSQGEYVFDQAWAEAFARAGGNYYPKLQVSVPFTPATGPRLLIADEAKSGPIIQALDHGLKKLCQRHNLSSAHITFLPQQQATAMEDHGWLRRTDTQFHWQNNYDADFDGFLAALSSRKRKNIRKERAGVAELGFAFEMLKGDEIHEHHWDAFFAFYQDTGARKWGSPYLTREFFSLISQSMADNVLLIMVASSDRYIAGALNFIGAETLYGRYWGAIEDHPGLHFETCYYRAMEFAIEHGLKTVEAGAQGPHKLARGYVPVTTCSVHHITHPSFAGAIEDYLERERTYVKQDNAILSEHTPFRKDNKE
jgi:predicted N-acyltransferase